MLKALAYTRSESVLRHVTMANKQQGFSLLEILIVLAIVAILTLAGYPSYQYYLSKSKRHQAKSALIQLAARMEVYHSVNGTYKDANENVLGIKELNEGLAYQLSITEVEANYFRLLAVPNAWQEKNDDCGTLTFTSAGERMSSKGAIQCWQ